MNIRDAISYLEFIKDSICDLQNLSFSLQKQNFPPLW